MNDYILIHSKEARFTAKKSNKVNINDVKEIAHSDSLLESLRNVGARNIKAKTFTEVSSIGLTGESKTVYYFKDDELFHFIDDGKVFDAKSEKDIERQIKARFRKGLWGDKDSFSRLKIDDGLIHALIKDFDENYLMHHGIKNQKWGERHGPPYPLDRQSPTERKTLKPGSNKRIGSSDKEGSPKHKTTKYGSHVNYNWIKTKDFHDSSVNSAWKERNNVDEVQEIYLNDGRTDYVEPAKVIKYFLNELNKNPYEMEPESFEDAAFRANPNYGQRGTTDNCVRCSAAMELRNRGFNVVAAKAHNGASQYEYETWFKDAHTKAYSSAIDMMKDLLQNGEGASGALGGFFGDGIGSGDGGHALHWSVKDRHLQIEDGQNGDVFNSFKEAWDHYGFNEGGCYATRLDNCEPNWDAMIEDSVIGISSWVGNRKWKQNGKIFNKF